MNYVTANYCKLLKTPNICLLLVEIYLDVKRKFTTNLLLLLALNLVVKPFWIFGIDRNIQNVVGPGEYGLFFALFNFSLLLNIALDFGLTNFNNREISQYPQLLSRYLSNMLAIRLIMALFYFAISLGAALLLGYTGRQLWLLLFLVINQFLSSLILYLRSNLSGLQFFKTDSILSVTDRVLMIFLCSMLLWTPLRESLRIELFLYSQTAAYAVTALVALALVVRKAEYFALKFDRRFFISIVRQSYPYALLVLLMSFHYRVDSVMLERLLPDGHVESGIYAQAFRLLDASTMVPFLFATLLLPIFSKMIRQGESVNQLLGYSFSLLYGVVFAFSVICIAYQKPIMELLYVNNTSESYAIFGILMAGFVFISISYIVGTLLTAHGSLRHLNIIALVGGIMNIMLNLYLIPSHKAMGAAISSLITQAFIAAVQLYVTFRVFRIRWSQIAVIRFTAFSVLVLGSVFFISKYVENWFTGVLIALAVSGALVFAFRIIRVKEVLAHLEINGGG